MTNIYKYKSFLWLAAKVPYCSIGLIGNLWCTLLRATLLYICVAIDMVEEVLLINPWVALAAVGSARSP